MSTAARKARKRAGIKFEKAPKVGTPVEERWEFKRYVVGSKGTRNQGVLVPRSPRHLERALRDRGLLDEEVDHETA